MPSGIKIKEVKIGTGKTVERGKVAVAHIRGFLRCGEECYNTHTEGQPACIDTSKRDCIAGLRKGLEGMRSGGVREITVSPHLAYGAEGVVGRIPPNALIRFKIELLKVLEPDAVRPKKKSPRVK